jgi:hypothetical protein
MLMEANVLCDSGRQERERNKTGKWCGVEALPFLDVILSGRHATKDLARIGRSAVDNFVEAFRRALALPARSITG